MICEKCWADSYDPYCDNRYERYLELLEERKDNPCVPGQERKMVPAKIIENEIPENNGKVTLKDDGKFVSAKYNLYNTSSSAVRVEIEYFWLSDGRWKRTTGKHKVHSGSPLNILTKGRRERSIACILTCKR